MVVEIGEILVAGRQFRLTVNQIRNPNFIVDIS
jgi:hypothetical protein